jgi:MFS family permease
LIVQINTVRAAIRQILPSSAAYCHQLSEHALTYGFAVAIAGCLSGALSNVWEPRRVITIGFVLWLTFEVLFLTIGLSHASLPLILITSDLRGLGYSHDLRGSLRHGYSYCSAWQLSPHN